MTKNLKVKRKRRCVISCVIWSLDQFSASLPEKDAEFGFYGTKRKKSCGSFVPVLPPLFGDDHLGLELVELGPQRVVIEQSLRLPAHL